METVRHALAWVAARRDVDPDRIGVVGISLGAALGLTVAGTEPRVRALVDYFGPLPQGAIPSGAWLPPTLILHGGADPIVPSRTHTRSRTCSKSKARRRRSRSIPGRVTDPTVRRSRTRRPAYCPSCTGTTVDEAARPVPAPP